MWDELITGFCRSPRNDLPCHQFLCVCVCFCVVVFCLFVVVVVGFFLGGHVDIGKHPDKAVQ